MDEVSRLEIQLLDANGEHVASEWLFGPENGAVVRVGRAADNDVVIGDRYVSRYHAEIRLIAGAWHVLSLGRHGMFCGGVAIEPSRRLSPGVQELQLGGTGTILRINVDTAARSDGAPRNDLTTMLFAHPPLAPQIAIDEAAKSRAVSEITTGEFFLALQTVRKRLSEQDEVRT